jgi:nucleoside-diphosphate-sugar epimerase
VRVLVADDDDALRHVLQVTLTKWGYDVQVARNGVEAWRILQGKPVLVHDGGQTVWTLTHSDDFAEAFTRLLGKPGSLGRAYHITSDEAPTWQAILESVSEVLGRPLEIRSVGSADLVGYEPDWEGPLLGDKANSMRFDNSAVREVIGEWTCGIDLQDGLRRVLPFVDQRLAAGYAPDPTLDALVDRILSESAS